LLTLPPLYIYVSRARAARRLKETGIGKGAPGFLTSVKRVAVTPEIAARIRRGETVTPEEIEASQRAVAAAAVARESNAGEKGQVTSSEVSSTVPSSIQRQESSASDSNEWLPDHLKNSNTPRKSKGKRR
jgi:hypothetical protein